MASEVQICNLALANLGQSVLITAINPPDGSVFAQHCAQFYPIARDVALEAHAWRFATRRAPLVEVTNPVENWAFAYQLPPKYIRALSVLLPESPDDTNTFPFAIETLANGEGVIYTNVENATMKYITQVTDTTKFSPMFVTTLSWLLSSFIAGPITKKPAVIESAYKIYLTQLVAAAGADSSGQDNNPHKDFTPDHIRARGVNGGFPAARVTGYGTYPSPSQA